jgi:hypothetical protein
MSNSYFLVNPYIQGEFKNKIKADNSVEGARQFYKALSEHFNNAVPKFYFTIQKGGSGKGKYYHFKVTEQRKNNNVSFTLESHDIIGNTDIDSFSNRLNEFKNKFAQSGGKKKKSKKSSKSRKSKYEYESESESDSESISDLSNDYKRINTLISNVNQPIYYWWYDPSIYKLQSYYIPTFYSYVTPVIEVRLNL